MRGVAFVQCLMLTMLIQKALGLKSLPRARAIPVVENGRSAVQVCLRFALRLSVYQSGASGQSGQSDRVDRGFMCLSQN